MTECRLKPSDGIFQTPRPYFPNTPPVAGLHGTQISLIKPQITAAIKPPFK
ncbi:hypothetical protein P7274_000717 [Neisseria gonorrhoeae]